MFPSTATVWVIKISQHIAFTTFQSPWQTWKHDAGRDMTVLSVTWHPVSRVTELCATMNATARVRQQMVRAAAVRMGATYAVPFAVL